MSPPVFIQPVRVAVHLDRPLRPGDALVVEARQDAGEGDLFVAEGEEGVVVGRYTTSRTDLEVVSLEAAGKPRRVRRDALRLRGVVIGLRSAL
jgi:SOS-response transcriptional repressor LexA